MSKENKITLETYDYNNKGPHLNSPYSKKTLELLGIKEKELLTLTLEEYINLNKDCKEIPPELQKERYNNYFKKHDELINKAKEKRKELISDEEIVIGKNPQYKIYHCELHKNNTFYYPKAKKDPNCEICRECEAKFEKLKERMKLSIQLEIDEEYEKKNKMKKQMKKHKKFDDFQDKKEIDIKMSLERKRTKDEKNNNIYEDNRYDKDKKRNNLKKQKEL